MTTPRPRSQPRLAANILLAAVTILVMWGLIEMLALTRLVDFRVVLSRASTDFTSIKPWDNPRNQPDSALLWIHRPRQRIQGNVKGDMVDWLRIATDRRYPVDVTYDGRGFRNARDRDSADVVLIGDSFLEWSIVATSGLVSEELERRLGAPVMNLGQAAYSPQQELLVLRRIGLDMKPRVVVWFFFEGNDLTDVPRFERFVVESRGRGMAGNASFRERSFIRNAARSLARRRQAPPLAEDGDEARRRSCRTRIDGLPATTLYFAYAGQPLSDPERESLGTVQRIVNEARLAVDSAGAHFLLVYIPTKFRVYSGLCEPPADGYARTWAPNELPAIMAAWADSSGIDFLDLTSPLQAASGHAPLLYFEDDGHWTAAGHAVAAAAVAARLQQRGWTARGAGPTP